MTNLYLIQLLSAPQPIVFKRPVQDSLALQKSIDRDYVNILFFQTKTEVGMKLYRPGCHLDEADFEKKSGRVTLCGGLILDGIKVKCHARIDLSTCTGEGYLEMVEAHQYDEIMGEPGKALSMT